MTQIIDAHFPAMTAAVGTAGACRVLGKARSTLYRQRHRVENMFGKLKPVLSLSKGTGAASTLATTDAPIPSCPPSASPQPSSSGSINES